jgi:hypothetical protein
MDNGAADAAGSARNDGGPVLEGRLCHGVHENPADSRQAAYFVIV